MSLIDYLFPRRCLGCGKTGCYFCNSCLQLIKSPKAPVCPVCFRPSFFGSTHARCQRPLSLDGLTSFFSYQGPVRQAIKKLKYKFVTDLAWELVSLTSQVIKENQGQVFPKFNSGWILVPIPLHPRRERWRGFNQAELLGKMIARQMSWQFCAKILRRYRFAKPQAELAQREKRRLNIRGVFKVDPDSQFITPCLAGRRANSKLLLFDDVWTSGSTIKEAAKVLKRRGVRKVWGMTLAR